MSASRNPNPRGRVGVTPRLQCLLRISALTERLAGQPPAPPVALVEVEPEETSYATTPAADPARPGARDGGLL